MRKANWRASKVKNDPQYMEKVRKYDRERKRNGITSRKNTSRKNSEADTSRKNSEADTSRKNSEADTSRKNSEADSQIDLPGTPVKSSPPSYYKVLSTSKKVQSLLGPSPNTHTTILKHVLNKAIRSPRKSKCMGEFASPPKNSITKNKENSITPPKESVGKTLRKIAVLRSRKKFDEVNNVAESLRSKYTVAEIAAYTGESTQTVYRLLSCEKPLIKRRKKEEDYSKKLTGLDKEEVLKIYNDDEVTYSLPDMKYAGLRFMHFTIREAYSVYLRKCKGDRLVAEKTFEALKPSFVRTVQETPLCGARCEYCANFGKTREALIGLGMKCIPRNHAEAVEATWCAFRKKKRDVITSRKQKDRKVLLHDLPRKECVLRECVMCGVTEYERKLLAQNRLVMRQGKEVHWKQWCPVKAVDKNGKPTMSYDGETTRVVLKLKRVRLFRELQETYQYSGLSAKCLLARLRSVI